MYPRTAREAFRRGWEDAKAGRPWQYWPSGLVRDAYATGRHHYAAMRERR